MKKLVAVLVLVGLATALLAACGGSPSSSPTTSPSSGATTSSGGGASTDVHMLNPPAFSPTSVTITKGSSINLVNDVTLVHIIQNGAWTNGTTFQVVTETGAPLVDKLRFVAAGDSHKVGPFNTAGTYHLFCNVHAGMNLTVIVQ